MTAHPLGFSKWSFPLPFGFRLRLHVWRPGAKVSSDRHTHRAGFVSVPLWGRFLDTRYRRTAGRSDQRAYAVPSPCTDEEGWVPLDHAPGLCEVDQHDRFPLVPYFCARSAIHNVQPLSSWAVSLVLSGRPVGEYTTVWRPLDVGEKEISR